MSSSNQTNGCDWVIKHTLVECNLIGQTPGVNGGVEILGPVRAMVCHGDQTYWYSVDRLWRKDLLEDPLQLPRFGIDSCSGLAIYEDRLYFTAVMKLYSARIDGTDVRVEDGGIGFPDTFSFDVTIMAVQGDRLIVGREKLLWQVHLRSREVTVLDPELPEIVGDIAASDDVVYWIGGGKVWRWRGIPGEHEPLYGVGDTRLDSLCVVSATPYPLTMDQAKRIQVAGRPDDLYQLLISEDLRFWSPDFVQSSLFTRQGTLGYLDPFTVSSQ